VLPRKIAILRQNKPSCRLNACFLRPVTNEPINGSDAVDWLVQFPRKANEVVKGK